MIADIYAIGCTKVVMVVTDTCAVMRKCWSIVEDEFPWISCAPCQTHCPSLLLTDVAKLPKVAQTIRDESLVVGWFTNHHKPLALLREKVLASKGRSCELKKAGATRMGTNSWVGERLEELKSCLQQVVVDPDYVAEKFKDLPADVDVVAGAPVAREHRGGTAKLHVLDDTTGGFWENVRDHVSLTMPLCKFLRRHDSSAPAVGKVYHGWFEMGDHLQKSQVAYAPEACAKHERRWAYAHCPFFAAAYVLDPEFADHDQSSCEEVMEGFFTTLEKVACLLKVRTMSEADRTLAQRWEMRASMIEADPLTQKTMTAFPTYPDSDDQDVKDFCSELTAHDIPRQKRYLCPLLDLRLRS